MRTLLLTGLALLTMASLPAQEASEAAPGPLARLAPAGDFRGMEDGAYGTSVGTTRWETLFEGHWVRIRYRSTLAGQPLLASILMLRSYPDGEVRGWHIDDHGQARRWRGRVSERGMALKQFDEEGRLLAMQVYQWADGGYEFQLFTRAGEDGSLQAFQGARYRALRGEALLETSAAAVERAHALPYAPYLGSFEGPERSPFGESTGRFRCVPVLDGGWYENSYASWREGEVVYAGVGYTRCAEDGSTLLLWFDDRGDWTRMAGEVTREGATATLLDAAGEVVERHTDTFTPEGYDYRIEVREGGGWLPYLEASYKRVGD